MSQSAEAPNASTWTRLFRVLYRLLGYLDPLIRAIWERMGLGNVVELRVRSRRTGRTRHLLLGLLRAGDGLYLGHPNGDSSWTRDLDAAGAAELVLRHGLTAVEIRPRLLVRGPERDAAIAATGQHPFPGDVIYRLAREHVLAVGRYYRLESVGPGPEKPDGPSSPAP